MMKVTWGPTSIGMMHKIVDESEAFEFVKALVRLGWNPDVQMLDNDSPKV